MGLKREHQKILKEFQFEAVGELREALKNDEFDDNRVIYAITNPEGTAVVYVGDTEQGRDVRGRLKAHLRDREKAGQIEEDSFVYIHVMVTEFAVLSAFEYETGALPALNKRKIAKFA
jgi:GIY-YIG catalytic domain